MVLVTKNEATALPDNKGPLLSGFLCLNKGSIISTFSLTTPWSEGYPFFIV